MSRDSLMQKVGWEHHVVSLIPELRVILMIKGQSISNSNESESGYDEEGKPEPHKES